MAKLPYHIPTKIQVPKREPWHYLFELNDIADAIDQEFLDKLPVELMEAICDEQHPIVRVLSSRLHRRFNKLVHVEGIGTSTIRELSLGTLRNMALGHSAEDIHTRLTTLIDRLDVWESRWRDTIRHNSYSVATRKRANPTYPPGPAAYLGDDASEAMHQLTEIDEYAAVTVATIRQLVNERKATITGDGERPELPEPRMQQINATGVTPSASKVWHGADETPPDEFKYGPLIGQRKQLAVWIMQDDDPRNLDTKLEHGVFWGRQDKRTQFSVWFKDQKRHAEANSRNLSEQQRDTTKER